VFEVPLHVSDGSQMPDEGRQVAPLANVSAGQVTPAPSQLSAMSQMPLAGRHRAVLFASAGHVADPPVQLSTRSQRPADARQTVDELARASAGQVFDAPLQVSTGSQLPIDGRHTAVLFASAGHVADAPVQLST